MKKTFLLALIISFSSFANVPYETEQLNLVVVNFDLPQGTVPIHPPVV